MSEIDHRRHRILDALLRALEAKGATISETEKGLLRASIDKEKLDFQVREKNRQVRVPKEDKRSTYLSQELEGTGRLVFCIRTYLRGPHNEEWNETDSRPLESQLPQIVDRLFERARILKEWEIEHELERERWRKEAEQRAERARLIKQEARRRQSLSELVRDWRTANEIRKFLTAAKAAPFDGEKVIHGRSVADWLTWAESAADTLDISPTGLEGLFSIIGSVKAESDAS